MTRKNRSKNYITIDQLRLSCQHVDEMLKAGFTINFAIRLLELFADTYARHYKKTRRASNVLNANDIDLWSKAAKEARKKNPRKPLGTYVRVEHGTPRRAFAKMVFELYRKKKLTEKTVATLVRKYWELAVITLDEDRRLNKIARSEASSTPRMRWAKAKIRF